MTIRVENLISRGCIDSTFKTGYILCNADKSIEILLLHTDELYRLSRFGLVMLAVWNVLYGVGLRVDFDLPIKLDRPHRELTGFCDLGSSC